MDMAKTMNLTYDWLKFEKNDVGQECYGQGKAPNKIVKETSFLKVSPLTVLALIPSFNGIAITSTFNCSDSLSVLFYKTCFYASNEKIP